MVLLGSKRPRSAYETTLALPRQRYHEVLLAVNLRQLSTPAHEVSLEELDVAGVDAGDDHVGEALLAHLLSDQASQVLVLRCHVADVPDLTSKADRKNPLSFSLAQSKMHLGATYQLLTD